MSKIPEAIAACIVSMMDRKPIHFQVDGRKTTMVVSTIETVGSSLEDVVFSCDTDFVRLRFPVGSGTEDDPIRSIYEFKQVSIDAYQVQTAFENLVTHHQDQYTVNIVFRETIKIPGHNIKTKIVKPKPEDIVIDPTFSRGPGLFTAFATAQIEMEVTKEDE